MEKLVDGQTKVKIVKCCREANGFVMSRMRRVAKGVASLVASGAGVFFIQQAFFVDRHAKVRPFPALR